MKNYYLLSIILLIALASFTNIASAQVASGPSDATTAPPVNASDVGKVLCAGTPISIAGPQNGGVDFTAYQWYKLDASGNKQLTASTGRTYTETPTAPGYYNYEVVTVNATGCTSPVSDVFKVYVLPPLTATITGTAALCAGVGTTVLTANPTPATGFALTYQWTRSGVNITGATTNTYTITGENTPGTITFGVNIAYVLSPSCTVTATDDVVIEPVPTKPSITAN
jgi:hypothetical protein